MYLLALLPLIFGALFFFFFKGDKFSFNSACKHLGVWAGGEDGAQAGSRYAELVHKKLLSR